MVLWLLLSYHGGASILILTNQKNGFLTVIVETRFSILEEFLPSPLFHTSVPLMNHDCGA